jgi:predicted DNA-binding transcriptional regulator YafY
MKKLKFKKDIKIKDNTRKKEYDKKIFRLMYMLNSFESKGKISVKELAKEFQVSERTVQRDLDLLNRTGFPLTYAGRGCHSFVEGFSLKRSMVSSEEASLLSFLYEIAKSLGSDFEDSFSNILKKVLYQDTESAFYAKIPEGIKLGKATPLAKELENAIIETKKVELYYERDKEEKWLNVDPLKIVFFDGFWYLVCRVSDKDWIIKLRLEHIKKLKVLDKHFKILKNLKAMLDESVNVWFSEKRDKRILVKVSKDIARFFKQKKYLPMQEITKENKDGSLLVQAKVCQYMEAIPAILRWLPHVQVLEPKEVKEDIDTRVKEYMALI